MLKSERQTRVLQLVRQKGFIHTDEIADELKVSTVTIRRDIKELGKQNLVRLEHGGATSVNFLHGIPEPLFEAKMQIHETRKSEIGKSAASLIHDGDLVIIDAGSTCCHLAMHLKTAAVKGLTVITNDIICAKELSSNPQISIILIGGMMRQQYYNTYGNFAEIALSNLRANSYFFAFDKFTIKHGFSSTCLQEVPLKQKMMEVSDKTIALCDSSKIGSDAPYIVCGMGSVDMMITDCGIDPDAAEAIKAAGIRVVVAGGDEDV